jgi:hypothetical protein
VRACVNLHIGKLPPELAVGMVIIGRGRCQLTVQGGTDPLVVVSECIDVGSDLGPHRGQVTQQPSQPVLVLGKEHCKQESRDSIPRQAICTYIYLSMHPSIHLCIMWLVSRAWTYCRQATRRTPPLSGATPDPGPGDRIWPSRWHHPGSARWSAAGQAD